MDVPLAYRQKDILERLIRKHRLGPRYVELGCGDAFTMEALSELGMQGVGVDNSPEAVRVARAKDIPGATYLEADFLNLDLKDEPLVLLLNVLEHFEDDAAVLRLLNGYLKIGGHLFLAMPSHSRAYGPADRLAGHYRRYDRADLLAKLHAAGFEPVEVCTIGFPIGNLYTWGYNKWLRLLRRKYEFQPENTAQTGFKDDLGHVPLPIQRAAGIAFPILRRMILLDRPFQSTDLGNNYLVMARKRTPWP